MDLIKNHAFMIDRENNVFPVVTHIYGNLEEIEETIYACEWLYNHINSSKLKQQIICFIKTWAIKGSPECSEDNLIQDLQNYLHNVKYAILSDEFINKHRDELIKAPISPYLKALNELLTIFINEYFLRARYGGYYDNQAGNKEMIFRISSSDFNWFDIIWAFVYDHKNQIESVTVVKDEEATGEDFVFSYKGHNLDKIPTKEFIELSGNPVVENLI